MRLYGNGSHALISFILNKIEEVCFKTYMKNSVKVWLFHRKLYLLLVRCKLNPVTLTSKYPWMFMN